MVKKLVYLNLVTAAVVLFVRYTVKAKATRETHERGAKDMPESTPKDPIHSKVMLNSALGCFAILAVLAYIMALLGILSDGSFND